MFIPHFTKNFDDTAARIKKHVAVLDKHWYAEIKKEFSKLCSEGKDYYEIDHTPDGFWEYYESLSEEEQYGTSCNFMEHVDFNIFWFNKGYSEGKVCGKGIIDKIIETTKEIIADAHTDANYNILKSLLEEVKIWVKEEIKELQDYSKYKEAEYIDATNLFIRRCEWDIDYEFNNKLKVLELVAGKPAVVNPEAQIKIKQQKEAPKEYIFDKSSLNEIFYKDAIELFTEVEIRLLERKYLDSNCCWKGNKKLLIALIHILNNRKYLKPIPNKNRTNYFKYYKNYFEKRYNINITEMAKPSKFPIKELKNFEPVFHFIADLD